MAPRQPVFNFLPYLFSLIALVLILIILVAGTNNALSSLYYLKTDTSSLSVPPALASSTFLADLSAVSGADLVGSPATASSLGLADSYTLLLLTSCALFSKGRVVCEKPRFGFGFDPASNLRLDSTSLQGSFPPALSSALISYHGVSHFISIAYLLSAILVALGPIAASLGSRNRGAGVAAAVLSSLASVLLLGAAVAAVVVFGRLNTQINSALSSSGIHSESGLKPVVLGFVAFVFALLAAIVFSVRARSGPASSRGRVIARNIGGAPQDSKGDNAAGTGTGDPKPGLWKRMPTWSRHQYVQVERQPELVKPHAAGGRSLEAVVVTSPTGTRRAAPGEDDDWAAEDHDPDAGYASETGGSGDGRKAIPLLNLGGNRRERDLDTAYEPYSGSASRQAGI